MPAGAFYFLSFWQEFYIEKELRVNRESFYKICKTCDFKWGDLNDFLGDPDTIITGYRVNFDELAAGTLLFEHSCGATLNLFVNEFKGLHEGPTIRKRATGTEECPEYCLYQDKLDICPANCECAYVRDIIYIIKSWPKY